MVYRIIEEGKQEDIESSKLKKKRSNLTGRTIIDKQGQKFGKLTIIEECDTPTFPGKVTWKCECDCGTIVSRTNSQLKKVKEQHCGCGKPKKPRNPRVPGIPKKDTTKSEQKRRHLQYLRRSKDKGYDFDLTEKEFYEKLELPCHYCGQPPTDNRTMTLDRVDNNRGYTIDNIVPACTWCNRAKNSLSTGDFLEQVSLIYHQHCRE
jgi:5-methylcytosine-specific restriction endonuclease McrA